MIHPSYKELMDKINEENAAEELPLVTSRYSIVLATSKRARQITNGSEPLATAKSGKALSVAVEELYAGKITMNPEPPVEEEEIPVEIVAEVAAEETAEEAGAEIALEAAEEE